MNEENKLPSEEALVLALQNHDITAMKSLYKMYSGALLTVISKVVNNPELAEDLLQEVFIKIWLSIDRYDRTKGRLFTWLLNLARNLAIDELRSKRHRNKFQNENIDDSYEFINAQNKVTLNIDTLDVNDIVSRLKPDLKEVLSMVYHKGYTHLETSDILKLPLGTVKTKVRTALMELRTFYSHGV